MDEWKRSVGLGLAWSTALFGIVNWLDFARKPACFDCGFPRGSPFTLYRDPGFFSRNGIGDILWTGVLADIAFTLASGVILAWLISVKQRKI